MTAPVPAPLVRRALIMMVHPPEELRDCQNMDVIRAVIFANGHSLLEGICQEVYRSWTSEPISVGDSNALVDAVKSQLEESIAHRRQQEGGG